jgi:hypothetical protein
MACDPDSRRARAARPAVFIGLLTAGAALFIPSAAQAQPVRSTEETRRFELAHGSLLRVNNPFGEVEVQGVPGRTVSLHIRREGPAGEGPDWEIDLSMPVEVFPDSAGVEIRIPRRPSQGWDEPGGGTRRHLRLRLELPADCALQAGTVAGHIQVDGVLGAITLEATSGRLGVNNARGPVQLGTVTGDITVSGSREGADVNTVSGNVVIEGAAGEVAVTCVSGDIEIRDSAAGLVRASNTGGDITFSGGLVPGGIYRLSSHSGDIRFQVAGRVGCRAQLSTFSGSLSVPLEFTLTGERISRRSLEGSYGSGEALVELTAFSGNVVLLGG